MSIYDRKNIHTGRLFAVESVSTQMGKRVLGELEASGKIEPEVTPSGRKYISANEAAIFHEELVG